jgi:fermentation-respiration switch protein FrsA (DUF1100 family)
MSLFKKKTFKITVGLFFAALFGIFIVERVVAYKINEITHPTHIDHYLMTLENGRPIEEVHFRTVDHLNLTGWYIPPKNGAVIILQHGYHANSAQMLPIGLMLARHGYGVLLFDFRGHGKSEGNTVTLGLFEVQDTDAAVNFLFDQRKISKIGLIGNSMGGATGVLAASKNEKIQVIAVEGVFSELTDEVGIGIQVQTPLPAFPFDVIFVYIAERETNYRFSDIAPVKAIGKISPRPILIMQGGNDKRINSQSGKSLFDAAGEPKCYWYEPSAEHVAIYKAAPKDYENHVIDFFNQYLLGIAVSP